MSPSTQRPIEYAKDVEPWEVLPSVLFIEESRLVVPVGLCSGHQTEQLKCVVLFKHNFPTKQYGIKGNTMLMQNKEVNKYLSFNVLTLLRYFRLTLNSSTVPVTSASLRNPFRWGCQFDQFIRQKDITPVSAAH